MTVAAPLSYADRVAVWDRTLEVLRATMRADGLREVTTPIRVQAPALEPWIDPIATTPGWLATSPELGMKRLLCRGAGSIFQISHVFRRAERGKLHAEEFHLVEWYRTGADETATMADAERLVRGVFEAVSKVAPGLGREGPRRWHRHGFLDVLRETTGLKLRGDEEADELRELVAVGSPHLRAAVEAPAAFKSVAVEVDALWSWTALFTAWSDDDLDRWLRDDTRRDDGVHIVDFPRALAALAETDGPTGARFESHVFGTELCNGYRELRDAVEQRRRFEIVAGLRQACDQQELPMPEAFLADLESPGLPACSGAALGLDRLLMLATGRSSLDEVSLDPASES